MRFTWVIIALVLLVAIAGCSKGNVLTGSSVAKTPVPAAAKESAPQEAAPADEIQEEETTTPRSDDSEETETVLGDVKIEEKDYSTLAGTCEVTSRGDIRVIDAEGKKTIYRDECLGGTVVEYTCDGKKLVTKLVNCPSGCTVENYVGKCA